MQRCAYAVMGRFVAFMTQLSPAHAVNMITMKRHLELTSMQVMVMQFVRLPTTMCMKKRIIRQVMSPLRHVHHYLRRFPAAVTINR
jgi:hypothetical protein